MPPIDSSTTIATPRSVRSTPTNIRIENLTVSTVAGETLVGPITTSIPPGVVALVVGSTPAGRYALACAVTGRLPDDRLIQRGRVRVGSATTTAALRAITALPQSWHVRSVETTAARRLAALAWAQRRQVAVIALSPGLEGLSVTQQHELLGSAQQLAGSGSTVILTASRNDINTHRTMTNQVINLDQQVLSLTGIDDPQLALARLGDPR